MVQKLALLCRVAAACFCLLLAGPTWSQADNAAQAQWEALNRRTLAADRAGDYPAAETAAKAALNFARSNFGERHPDTTASLNNLALVYSRQGRYAEAEPLYAQALQLSRAVLGRHPDTISSLNNLASVYVKQGRY